MTLLYQRTIKNIVKTSGIGLHSGKLTNLTLRPLDVNSGIIFRKINNHSEFIDIDASNNNTVNSELSTTIEKGGHTIKTIEHLMATFYGLGIDNIMVEVDNEEIPILDGSASPFVYLIKTAGIELQSSRKKFIKILKPIEVFKNDAFAKFLPFNGFKASFQVDFQHPSFNRKNQILEIDFSDVSFEDEISRARTFGFVKDVEALRKKGLVMGGSINNAVVLDDFKIVNPKGLRFEDELIRHKILDALGDICLLGHPLIGHFQAYKSGHSLNDSLCKKLLEMKDAYEIVDFSDKNNTPKFALKSGWAF